MASHICRDQWASLS